MKTLQTLFVLGLAFLLIALLTFGAIKVTKEVEKTIASGISNLYNPAE